MIVTGWCGAGNDVGYHHRSSGAPAREISTPHIDGLVAEGRELSRHYAYQWCTPSRAAFVSGRLPIHIARLGGVCLEGEGVPREMTGIGAKLKAGGYRTAQYGKWDAGMSSPDHSERRATPLYSRTRPANLIIPFSAPLGRGFDEGMCYFDHQVEYFTYRPQSPYHYPGKGGVGCSPNQTLKDLWASDKPAASAADGTYEELIMYRAAAELLATHPVQQPLFMYYAFHAVHSPLELPPGWEDRMAFIQDSLSRRHYHTLVSFMDEIVGNLTSILKQRGMWSNTLVVSSSDNGGPEYGIDAGRHEVCASPDALA